METRHQKSESEMMSKILQSRLVWERKESKPTALMAQAENCGGKRGLGDCRQP